MSDKIIRIVIDAMGGDKAPGVTVAGTCLASKEYNAEYILVGDEEKIKAELLKHDHDSSKISIVHTPDEITMHDSPKEAIKTKPNASVLLAAKILKENKASAMVSAGSTGAVILAAAKHIDRIPGIKHTALGTLYPTHNRQKRKDIFSLMMDIGANVTNTPVDLVHYAYLGTAYVRGIKGIKEPTVALLNIGAEDHKGNETLQTAYKLLSSRTDLNFIGNIEGNDLMKGIADVVITEGMTGNIAMKTMEGTAEAVVKLGKMAMKGKLIWKLGLLCLSGGIKNLMKVADYQEYGGAPIFGFDRIIVKSHGRSTAVAYKNGIKIAIQAVENDMMNHMENSIFNFENEK